MRLSGDSVALLLRHTGSLCRRSTAPVLSAVHVQNPGCCQPTELWRLCREAIRHVIELPCVMVRCRQLQRMLSIRIIASVTRFAGQSTVQTSCVACNLQRRCWDAARKYCHTLTAIKTCGADIVEALTEAVADGDKKLRRRAMAALGELLFFVASQQRNAAQARVVIPIVQLSRRHV